MCQQNTPTIIYNSIVQHVNRSILKLVTPSVFKYRSIRSLYQNNAMFKIQISVINRLPNGQSSAIIKSSLFILNGQIHIKWSIKQSNQCCAALFTSLFEIVITSIKLIFVLTIVISLGAAFFATGAKIQNGR